ncbi:DUF2190 family protein [Gynuella sp.]|uniref:DUF2190 family protein n=1 Tax=Gynuella sp. TaxID=2969146 RepID=UPI003D0BBD55
MKTHSPILVMSITALSDIAQRRFVGLGGDVCAAGAKALGATEFEVAAGEQASVNAIGAILIEAAGAISAGAEVESDANGKAVTLSAGISNGYALDAATADGDIIRIVRGI